MLSMAARSPWEDRRQQEEQLVGLAPVCPGPAAGSRSSGRRNRPLGCRSRAVMSGVPLSVSVMARVIPRHPHP